MYDYSEGVEGSTCSGGEKIHIKERKKFEIIAMHRLKVWLELVEQVLRIIVVARLDQLYPRIHECRPEQF